MSKIERIKYLSEFLTPNRFSLLSENSKKRTKYLTVVLEDIYQPHNASAVLRTCDCFGIQDVHIIENKNEYTINPDVALGSSKWLSLQRYNTQTENTVPTIQGLKQQGYRIVATTPHTDDVNLENFDLRKGKTALLFGTELRGLTQKALSQADEFLKIPMLGFTESFNISVSAAIILHHLSHKLRNSDLNWQLSSEEQQTILLDWMRNSIKNVELIEKRFEESQNRNFFKQKENKIRKKT